MSVDGKAILAGIVQKNALMVPIDCILLAENRVWQQAVLKRVSNVQISYKVEYSLTVQINMTFPGTVFHRVT
jgi:hypothetical protein